MAHAVRWVWGCAIGALLGCAPEAIRLDLDPLRAAGIATLTLAVVIAGEPDVFVLDLDAPEPARVLPAWAVDGDEPIRIEAHGFMQSPDLLGLTPGRLSPPSGPSASGSISRRATIASPARSPPWPTTASTCNCISRRRRCRARWSAG